jgi:hypothetical protein
LQAKPEYLDRLLDEAKALTGSDYATAKMLKVGRATVSQYRKGTRTCPPADVALLAELCGYDATAWTARAVAQAYEGTEKGTLLSKALKKALVATGAAIVSSGAKAAAILSLSTDLTLSHFIRCIERLTRKSSPGSGKLSAV